MAIRICLFVVILVHGFASGAAEPEKLDGICYGPYRDNESPLAGVFPLPSAMEQDITLVAKVARSLRTYSVTQSMYLIPEMCEQQGVDCYPAAWLGRWAAPNDLEIETLIRIANKKHRHVKAVIVGNEVLHRGDLSEQQVVAYVRQVKKAVGTTPVAVAETHHAWKKHPRLAADVDVVMVQIYPYWDHVSIERGAAYTLEQVKTLQKMFPKKKLIVSETGWPTAGDKQGPAVANPENAARYFREVTALLRENKVPCLYFAMFDEKWKVTQESEQGRHWGLYESSGRCKPVFAQQLPAAARAGIKRPPRKLKF